MDFSNVPKLYNMCNPKNFNMNDKCDKTCWYVLNSFFEQKKYLCFYMQKHDLLNDIPASSLKLYVLSEWTI